jgi:hypothetical protein
MLEIEKRSRTSTNPTSIGQILQKGTAWFSRFPAKRIIN